MILMVELFRARGFYPRSAQASALVLFCRAIQPLPAKFSRTVQV